MSNMACARCILTLMLVLMSYHISFQSFVYAQEDDIIDYTNIQNVLKEDGLEKILKKKKKIKKKIKKEKSALVIQKYSYPSEQHFWSFMSELWIVKNAPILKWDETRPNYGIGIAFKALLEKIGIYNIKFKILVLGTPEVPHMGLPSNPKEAILLLSLPFMRTLDLTKEDIGLLLLENYLRITSGFFKKNISIAKSIIGENFYKDGFDKKKIDTLMGEYSHLIFKKGFNFQQQYEVTKAMDRLLRPHPGIWNTYYKLLEKIKTLTKSNLLYKSYSKIYPSPEIQRQWLLPKDKRL